MTLLAAPGDTWGIGGPQFLYAYLALFLLFLIAAFGLRSSARSASSAAGRLPTPAEAAYLVAGPSRAVQASVAGLRGAGAIGAGANRTLAAAGPLPSDASRLDGAVYEAARRGVPLRSLVADPLVASAVAEVDAGARRAGWLMDASQRSRARLGSWLLLGLVAFGAVRITAGIANDKAVTFLVILAIFTFVAALLFFAAVPRVTRSGQAALAELRTRSAHLQPSAGPAWATYGASGAALGVALYGVAFMWAADPVFAAEAGLPARSTSGSTDSTGGDSGSSCSGGDGGGGCGGGGCGG
jgi:uncharacterized protein (TIGR04222 family)